LYKLFLTLRYLRKRRIAYFAIAAVTLCVWMVLVVMSVMGGFLDTLKTQARGLLGDIIVENNSFEGFPLYQEFIDEVKTWPEIEIATPVIYSYGLLRFKQTDQTSTVRVVGLNLAEAYRVNAFKQSLYYEKWYPGTTSLAPQKQPLIGVDPKCLQDPNLEPRLVLPPGLELALENGRRQNGPDPKPDRTELADVFNSKGWPAIPGVYDLNFGEQTPQIGLPDDVGNELPGLIIGRDIVAERLADGRYDRPSAYPRGCTALLTLLPAGADADPEPAKQPFRYTDDSRTGIYEIDSKHVYCDFTLLQGLLHMDAAQRKDGNGLVPARCSQIQIKIRPEVGGKPVVAYELARRLEALYQSYLSNPRFDLDHVDRNLIGLVRAKTWEQSQAHIIGPVEKERQLVTILFGIISLVAIVLVLCILYMIVLQKTRDIGIVKSIGGSSTGVAAIFLIYGAAVGIVGSVLGSILGTLFVHHINGIQAALTWMNPAWEVWNREVYSFDMIPNTVRADDVASVVIVAIVASTCGALAAAWRAGSMQPVEALRYE
jgi:lipoprotein-releasing system permease protein